MLKLENWVWIYKGVKGEESEWMNASESQSKITIKPIMFAINVSIPSKTFRLLSFFPLVLHCFLFSLSHFGLCHFSRPFFLSPFPSFSTASSPRWFRYGLVDSIIPTQNQTEKKNKNLLYFLEIGSVASLHMLHSLHISKQPLSSFLFRFFHLLRMDHWLEWKWYRHRVLVLSYALHSECM